MLTIKKLSSTGFQTLNNTWYSVDVFKILKNKKFSYPFELLKIGDQLDNLKFHTGKDNKEYVIDYIVINHNDIGVKENSPLVNSSIQQNSLNNSPSPINVPLSLGSDVLEREGKALNPQISKTPSVQDLDSKKATELLKLCEIFVDVDEDVIELCMGLYPKDNSNLLSMADLVKGVQDIKNRLKPKDNNIQDNINFSLALKLAFNSTNINGFETEDKWIDFTFDRAEKILNKINKRLK